MNQAFLGHEQKFYINGTQVSGVTSVDGSYGISERPINILGWGHINNSYYDSQECNQQPMDQKFQSMSVLDSPMEGSFSINSNLVSEDFFLKYTGDYDFLGSIHYGDKYFGFNGAYITSHSVSCSVGSLPTTSTSISVFGDIGGNKNVHETPEANHSTLWWEETHDGDLEILDRENFSIFTSDQLFQDNGDGTYSPREETFKSRTLSAQYFELANSDGDIKLKETDEPVGYDASGPRLFPEIRIPNQGSITVECDVSQTNRVTSFDYSVNVDISPIYAVGSAYPVQVDIVWPVEVNASFSLDVDEYEYSRLRKYLISPNVRDVAIKINDCFGKTIQNYEIKSARLMSEGMQSSVDGKMTVDLSYKSFYNKR